MTNTTRRLVRHRVKGVDSQRNKQTSRGRRRDRAELTMKRSRGKEKWQQGAELGSKTQKPRSDFKSPQTLYSFGLLQKLEEI